MKNKENISPLPCPFCGGEAAVEPVLGWQVMCSNSQCIIVSYTECVIGTKEEAIKVWNVRHYPPEVQKAVNSHDRLVEFVEELTSFGGKYHEANGSQIVADACRLLKEIKGDE